MFARCRSGVRRHGLCIIYTSGPVSPDKRPFGGLLTRCVSYRPLGAINDVKLGRIAPVKYPGARRRNYARSSGRTPAVLMMMINGSC